MVEVNSTLSLTPSTRLILSSKIRYSESLLPVFVTSSAELKSNTLDFLKSNVHFNASFPRLCRWWDAVHVRRSPPRRHVDSRAESSLTAPRFYRIISVTFLTNDKGSVVDGDFPLQRAFRGGECLDAFCSPLTTAWAKLSEKRAQVTPILRRIVKSKSERERAREGGRESVCACVCARAYVRAWCDHSERMFRRLGTQPPPPVAWTLAVLCDLLLASSTTHPIRISDCWLTLVCPSGCIQQEEHGRDDMARDKRQKKTDPNAPKRPTNAFMRYATSRRNEIPDDQPKGIDFMRQLGQEWAALSKLEKEPYLTESMADLVRARAPQCIANITAQPLLIACVTNAMDAVDSLSRRSTQRPKPSTIQVFPLLDHSGRSSRSV
jgi:hypothetical protein